MGEINGIAIADLLRAEALMDEMTRNWYIAHHEECIRNDLANLRRYVGTGDLALHTKMDRRTMLKVTIVPGPTDTLLQQKNVPRSATHVADIVRGLTSEEYLGVFLVNKNINMQLNYVQIKPHDDGGYRLWDDNCCQIATYTGYDELAGVIDLWWA
jgi:hypothetical protein